MIAPSWVAAGVAGAAAVAAGLADRIGWVDWRGVQMAAMLALMVAAGVALTR